MTITSEAIQDRLQALREEERRLADLNQETVNALNACLGAQQDCLYWLELLEQAATVVSPGGL